MHVHILGICGTFMAGVALIARELGHQVSGSDNAFYPPMSGVLERAGIRCYRGYDPQGLPEDADVVVIGNALSRGNPAVEYVLDRAVPYTSGPAWLAEHVLQSRWVIGLAGTHGKTTTSSMVAWILEAAGLNPGFLIGGLPANFGVSARSGDAPFFVVEADEYDTAFFDKRSKFVHYRPRTAVITNLEYDHADIFPDLGAIQTQFHHLIRTVPSNGAVIHSGKEAAVDAVLERGLWSEARTWAGSRPRLSARLLHPDASAFAVCDAEGESIAEVHWSLIGTHNVDNALAALLASEHAGVPAASACEALAEFKGVSRRLELRGVAREVRVYDDFAHHPTAIQAVLEALGKARREGRVLAVLEPRSNTMRLGVHSGELAPALACADQVWAYQPPDLDWSLQGTLGPNAVIHDSIDALVDDLVRTTRPGDHVVIMSNGSFEGIHQRLLDALART